MIPYGKQDISQQDIDAVVEALKSDFLTQGPQVPIFENTLTSLTGAANAVAVNSATSALHIACLALGLKPGDWLWTSPITYVASANCGLYCGANVDFVDIDPHSWNMSPRALAAKLVQAKQENCLPKVVVPVHLAGQSCDMQAIKKLADEYGFSIIEDASHAIGGQYKGKFIGNCEFSDITVFSFHPVKIVTTGEGGAALCNDDALAQKMHLLRNHGVTRDENLMQNTPHGAWYYEQVELGFNYRMTDIQAALGVNQMQRLETFVKRRHSLINNYQDQLKDLPLQLPCVAPDTYTAGHLYIVRLQLEKLRWTHAEVFTKLREQGIGVNLHYMPVYKQPYYSKMGFEGKKFPNAEHYYSEAISLPLFPGMSESQQQTVVAALQDIL